MSITSELGITVALGRTLSRLGSHWHSIGRLFRTRSIWLLHGVLSGLHLVHTLRSPLVNSGILNEQFWLRIDGFRITIDLVIVYICSVRRNWNTIRTCNQS